MSASNLEMPSDRVVPKVHGVPLSFCRGFFPYIKYLSKEAHMFFLNIDSTKEVYISDSSNYPTTVAYTNGIWWTIVHPSDKKTITSLDE